MQYQNTRLNYLNYSELEDKRMRNNINEKQDFYSNTETFYLLSIPGMRESILEGLETPIEVCSEDLEW